MKFIKLIIFITSFLAITPKTLAVYDPRSVPNNRYGIHILDPSEITAAAQLVNSNGGEWGYITVPIRGNDRDRQKWLTFFTKAHQLKAIPILRLATFGRGDTWIMPTEEEMLDFANFLNQFPWPTQNRYIIVFNETNHSLEWGGYVDPESYAEILDYTINIFKSRHPDFFILPAALDMAAPSNHLSLDPLSYWKKVFQTKPELADKIDGWNSHAYPNPGFTGSATDTHLKSIISYQRELKELKTFIKKDLPIFITEAGWDQEKVTDARLLSNWQKAYQIWNDPKIVAITPFILQAHDGPFTKFSFYTADDKPKIPYEVLSQLPKTIGQPRVNKLPAPVLASHRASIFNFPKILGDQTTKFLDIANIVNDIIYFISNFFTPASVDQSLTVNKTKIEIEIADDPDEITLGLGHRQSMAENHGMLFVFPQLHTPSFWMKNTLFPLDIIWIADDKVVDITPNIPVEPDPANPKNFYIPTQPVNRVLEVNAGFAEKNGIKIGDKIKITNNQ